MPTPVGHAVGGLISISFFQMEKKWKWPVLLLVLVYSELPDIDFLFGMIEGNPNKYHHLFMHSFAFIIWAALVGAFIINEFGVMQFSKSFVLFSIAGATHLVFDLLALDTSVPFGAPIFWPFWNGFVISPITIFSDVHRSSSNSAFLPSLFSFHNLKTVLIEVLILGPVWLIVKSGKKNTREIKHNVSA